VGEWFKLGYLLGHPTTRADSIYSVICVVKHRRSANTHAANREPVINFKGKRRIYDS